VYPSLFEIHSVTLEIRRRKKTKIEETTTVKYKPFGIAMPCELKSWRGGKIKVCQYTSLSFRCKYIYMSFGSEIVVTRVNTMMEKVNTMMGISHITK